MKILFSILILVIVLGACKRESELIVPPVEVKPMVKLLSPTVYQHYHPGDIIIISGEASAGFMLHGYHLMVFDKKTGDTLFQDDGHTHANQFLFSDTMVHNLTGDYSVQAFVKAYINHDHDFIADSVDFYLLAQ